MELAQDGCWDDIEYFCAQVQSIGSTNCIRDIFTRSFMREYTYFVSFEALLQSINASGTPIQDANDLLALDTPHSDQCIAHNSELDTWRDFVRTACEYYLSENLK